ncbi:hypothetical protein MWU65_07385 [Cellulophaga sp. F20128]|uniref:hypothetical protein n=1 Tax=Cellulophaga sp. F20128 TaxID=2926413 RepID=UPI001FF2BAC1|nr:hypothetical protein [Cellulophaga sp. F20128]MCK0156998.1 hypothetical protein [Cellulophaga sp. F20128]
MARAMFDYTKTVLQKVSFDAMLFCRELEKATSRLRPYEIDELKLWLISFLSDKPELRQCMIYIKD